MREHGIALVSVLFGLVAVLSLASALFFSVFVDVQASSNAAAGEVALYAADAGIARLEAELDPAFDFSRELAWAGGGIPFGSIAGFPAPPRTYRVQVEASGADLLATAEGTGPRGARRRVRATFRRDVSFRPRAALIFAAGATSSELAGTIVIEPPSEPHATAVGGETRAEVAWLRSIPSLAGARTIGSTGLAAAARDLLPTAATTLPGPEIAGTWGDAASGASVRIVGPAEVVGDATIAGCVVVDGPLTVSGRLEVDGLLLATGGVSIAGEVTVRGAAFVAGDLRMAPTALFRVSSAADALDLADAAAGGRLPRVARRIAWRELW